jgi:uncharacterized protein (DUF488 family)
MNHTSPERSDPVLTIGHSTRTLEDFVHLLQAHGVEKVIDVRTIPRSRDNPQFNRETLPYGLREFGIGYMHMPGLGGLRHPRPDSPNLGWRNASFRGYADYMQTREFEAQLQELIKMTGQGLICLMCAEVLPWRCHRSLIADALIVRGIQVEHILSPTRHQAHLLTPWAQVMGTMLTYPPAVPPDAAP